LPPSLVTFTSRRPSASVVPGRGGEALLLVLERFGEKTRCATGRAGAEEREDHVRRLAGAFDEADVGAERAALRDCCSESRRCCSLARKLTSGYGRDELAVRAVGVRLYVRLEATVAS